MAYRVDQLNRTLSAPRAASWIEPARRPKQFSPRKEAESVRGILIGLAVSAAVWSSLGLLVSHLF